MFGLRLLIPLILLIVVLVARIGHSAAPQIPQYDLDVSFDIPRSKVVGLSKIRVLQGERLLLQARGLAIQSVEVNRKSVNFQVRDNTLTIAAPEGGILEIRYEGVFEPPKTISALRDREIPNVVSREGVFLTFRLVPADRQAGNLSP